MNTYKKIVSDMFHSVGQAIGIHVMLLVVEHALWKTKSKYEEASLIQFSEEGIILEDLDKLDPERARIVLHEFLMSLISTLGKLVGIQLARQLTEQLQESNLVKEE